MSNPDLLDIVGQNISDALNQVFILFGGLFLRFFLVLRVQLAQVKITATDIGK